MWIEGALKIGVPAQRSQGSRSSSVRLSWARSLSTSLRASITAVARSSVLSDFPAREVVVAVMGTLYAVGSGADESSLSSRLKSAAWPDGRPVFTLPMVLGLMVFYAWCLQCAATVATIRRETNSWRWPVFAWTYMTTAAYLGALAVYQLGSLAVG